MLPPMPPRPRVHQLPVPNLTDIDFGKLRAGRLARLQTMLKRHDFPVALLYNTANIRYATGVDVMSVWTAGTFARYCLVPAEGAPILFEYKGSIHVSQKVVHDVRPAYTWQYGGVAARDKVVMPGDLVGVDTDANGYEGYVIDVSRTFLCGDTPSPEQKEAYRVAYDCVNGMFDLVRPGMSFAEFAAKAPRVPAAYAAQRYPTMVHQAGLEDEGPGIPYPDDDRGPRRIMPERELKENMVLCLECYAGKPGAPFGVKLEDQVLVTAEGARLICTYPYEAKLLD